jgi:hypothetical protein
LAIGILRLDGHANIAAANRHHARGPQRTLKVASSCMTTTLPGPCEFVLVDVLVEPGDRLRYTYDFGDDWDHDIRLEKVLAPAAGPRAPAVPVCLAGKGACPPEDCGGPWGYAALKETIADPSDEGHEEMLEWLGLEDPSDFDPAAFNLASVNARLHGPV